MKPNRKKNLGEYAERGGPGRPKGCQNKFTGELKAALMEPFDPERFAKWALKNQAAYYTLIVTKLLPKDLNVKNEPQTIEELLAMADKLPAAEKEKLRNLGKEPDPEPSLKVVNLEGEK